MRMFFLVAFMSRDPVIPNQWRILKLQLGGGQTRLFFIGFYCFFYSILTARFRNNVHLFSYSFRVMWSSDLTAFPHFIFKQTPTCQISRYRLRPSRFSSESPTVCPAAVSSSSPGTSASFCWPASPPGNRPRKKPRRRLGASSPTRLPCSPLPDRCSHIRVVPLKSSPRAHGKWLAAALAIGRRGILALFIIQVGALVGETCVRVIK